MDIQVISRIVLVVTLLTGSVHTEDDNLCSQASFNECLSYYSFMSVGASSMVPEFSEKDLDIMCGIEHHTFNRIREKISFDCYTVERLLLDGMRDSFEYACDGRNAYDVFDEPCGGDIVGACDNVLSRYTYRMEEMFKYGTSKIGRDTMAEEFCMAVEDMKTCEEAAIKNACPSKKTKEKDVAHFVAEMHRRRLDPLLNNLGCIDAKLEGWLIACIIVAAVFMIFIIGVCIQSMRGGKSKKQDPDKAKWRQSLFDQNDN